MKPQDNILWPTFLKYCTENCINTEDHEEDWIAQWETWYEGAKAGIWLIETGRVKIKNGTKDIKLKEG
jgi:hypothetical protein